MELVDMNSLGLFDSQILSVQVGFTLQVRLCKALMQTAIKYVLLT